MDLAGGDEESDATDLLNLDLDNAMETLIYAPELQDFFGQGNMDFISFLTNMWDMPEEYKHSYIKSKQTTIIKPTINLIGGATATTLADIFPDKISGQGFLSRSLLIFGKGARQRITFPKVPDETTGMMLTNILMEIKKHAVGHAVLTSAAEDCLDEIYKSWNPIADVRLETYSGRRFTSLLKNCMLLAVSDLNSFNARGVTITEEHVIYANSMLTFAEGFMSRALGNLGNNRNLEVQNKVTAVLEKTEKGMLLLDLHKHLTSEVDSIVQLGEVVKHMLALGKLALNPQTKRLFALATGPVIGKHCDFNLLREGQEYYAELDEPKHEVAPTLDEQFGLKVTEATDTTSKLIL